MEKEELISQILEATHRGRQQRNHHHEDSSSFRVLKILFHAKEEVHPTDLCHRLEVTTPRITSILNELESEGLVERRIYGGDHRKIVIVLTEKGKSAVEKRILHSRERISALIDTVGMEDAEAYLRVVKAMQADK